MVDLNRKMLHRDRVGGQAVRFIIVGAVNTVVDLGLFYGLSRVMPHLPAKAISYGLGICNSFIWNKYWTFGAAKSSRGWREFGLFVAVNIPPWAVNGVVFTLLGLWLHSGNTLVYMSKAFAAAIITVAWNFVGSRYLAFRHSALKGADRG